MNVDCLIFFKSFIVGRNIDQLSKISVVAQSHLSGKVREEQFGVKMHLVLAKRVHVARAVTIPHFQTPKMANEYRVQQLKCIVGQEHFKSLK